MTDIGDFLRARLDDTERVARAAASATLTEGEHPVWIQGEINYVDFDEPVIETHPDQAGVINDAQDTVVYDEGRDPALDTHIALHDPARVLREVNAKRRTLARHAGCGLGTGWCDDGGHGWDEELGGGCPELGDMALPYASHPDYDERWKP